MQIKADNDTFDDKSAAAPFNENKIIVEVISDISKSIIDDQLDLKSLPKFDVDVDVDLVPGNHLDLPTKNQRMVQKKMTLDLIISTYSKEQQLLHKASA